MKLLSTLLAAGAALVMLTATTPAEAGWDRHHGRHHWQPRHHYHHNHHGHHRWHRPYYQHSYGYYYAPPRPYYWNRW